MVQLQPVLVPLNSSVRNPPLVLPSAMNPAQQHAPSSNELRFVALQQALADSQARGAKTKEKLEILLNGFLKLEKLISEQQLLPTTPKTSLIDIIPVRSAPTGQPPPLALPSEFDGDHSRGQAFLNSVTFHTTDPTPSLSPLETLRRRIVDHQTLPVVRSLFPSGQFPSQPKSSGTLPYAKSPLPYPLALHLSMDSVQHMHDYSASQIMVTHGGDTICSVSFATRIFHFTTCSSHITMCFLIFDILSIMCSLPSYKPLCFSSSYLNIEYLSCHS